MVGIQDDLRGPDDSGVTGGNDRRTRRALLGAGIAALAATAATAIGRPTPVSAASVQLGQTNTNSNPTTFRNPRASSTAKAVVAETLYTGAGAGSAGVTGTSRGRDGNGVIGRANRGTSAYGVWGQSDTGTGVRGTGDRFGVSGYGDIGVRGTTDRPGGVGVSASAFVADGVGVLGYAPSGPGVRGMTDDADTWGELGYGSRGVAGYTNGGTAIYGVDNSAQVGWAAFLDGDVYIGGNTYPVAIARQVDHPDAPGERWYRSALIGSPEALDVVSGNARTGADGRVTVRLPRVFARFHRDFRYQLTPLARVSGLHVAGRVRDGRFVIAADQAGALVSWQVTGVRSDPSAQREAFRAEVTKSGAERGRFAEPALYGKSRRRALKVAPTSRPRVPARGRDKATTED